MAGHQGLHKVVKTVKGKKGSTHRAYWVKNDAGPAAHPGIMHRVAVGAGKVALAGAAAAATVAVAAFAAHKLSSHLAAHGGGGPDRGVLRHAGDQAALAHLKASNSVSQHIAPIREHVQDFMNMHKASRSASHTQAVDSANIRKAAEHIANKPHPHFGAGSAEPRRHFGAGTAETRRHFGAGTAEASRPRGHAKITGDASRALAADFALDRVIGRSRRR